MNSEVNYWHMQMHPDDKAYAEKNIHSILEHKKIIGLGHWQEGMDNGTIDEFNNKIKVNDVVAIKNGAKLIALVQVIGGSYQSNEAKSDINFVDISWIKYRRPIRVLDWELSEELLPQPMGTLNRCANDDVKTTKIIKNWHSKVIQSFQNRGLDVWV